MLYSFIVSIVEELSASIHVSNFVHKVKNFAAHTDCLDLNENIKRVQATFMFN
jgi:hypothetical protein